MLLAGTLENNKQQFTLQAIIKQPHPTPSCTQLLVANWLTKHTPLHCIRINFVFDLGTRGRGGGEAPTFLLWRWGVLRQVMHADMQNESLTSPRWLQFQITKNLRHVFSNVITYCKTSKLTYISGEKRPPRCEKSDFVHCISLVLCGVKRSESERVGFRLRLFRSREPLVLC